MREKKRAHEQLTNVALPINELLLITKFCAEATARPKLNAPERTLSETSPPRDVFWNVSLWSAERAQRERQGGFG